MVGRKRKAAAIAEAETAEMPATPRRSQRASSSAKKSKYFEPTSESEAEPKASRAKVAKKVSNKAQKPAKKTKKAKEIESDEEDDYKEEKQVEDDDEEEQKTSKNDDSDDEFDENAPPKVTFIPIPGLRDTGGVAYVDDRLHQNTLAFLQDLKANNKRTWLKSHDAEYRRSLKDWESYVSKMTEKIIEADETIPELPFKDINFRIYRDIRFSNDPTPYKPHYSAAWSRTGRKGPYACYYVHVEPGKSFVGGGLWHPDGEAVQRLRASIDERPRRWRRVLTQPAFRRTFLPQAKDGSEAAALKAFAAANAENALKTKPKGFVAEHRDIELLKLRNFTVMKKLPDNVFVKDGGQDEIAEIIGAMVGFVAHLNRIVKPDPMDDDPESESDEDSEGMDL